MEANILLKQRATVVMGPCERVRRDDKWTVGCTHRCGDVRFWDAKRKSDFGADKAAFDPTRTWPAILCCSSEVGFGPC